MTVTGEAPTRWPQKVTAAWQAGPLSLPEFRLLTIGQFASTLGDYCYAVALPWLVLSDHGSTASLGIVLGCYGVARAGFTVPGGWLADRFGPGLVMMFSDLARCGLTAVFVVLAAGHVSSLAVLAPVAAALGMCAALFLPASYAMMPTLIDGARLTSANAVYSGTLQVGQLLGPVLGGVLVAVTGPAAAFGVDAASYLASAASLALIAAARRRPRAADLGDAAGGGPDTAYAGLDAEDGPDAEGGFLAGAEGSLLAGTDAAGGSAASAGAGSAGTGSAGTGSAGTGDGVPASAWQLLRRERILQIVLLVSVAANFAITGTTEVALPALSHARFGADGYGAILACTAVGSLAGTAAAARLMSRARPATLIGAAFLVAALAIGVVPFLGGVTGAAGSMLVFGIAIGFDGVVSVTVIQQWAPSALLGRLMGLMMLASVGSFPVSTFVAGVLSRHLGPAPVFPVAGLLLALAVLFGLSQREFREFGPPPGGGTAG